MAAEYIALAGLQLWSGLQQAEMIRGQAKLSKMIADLNAEAADQDAWEANKYGISQAARYDSVVDATIGEQRVAFASKNVDVNSGTAKAIQDETKLIGFLNALDIQKAGRAKALGLKMEASNIRLGGYMSGLQSNMAATGIERGALFNAGATYLSGYDKRTLKGDV